MRLHRWSPVGGLTSRSGTYSHYAAEDCKGRFYIKTTYFDGATCFERFPSQRYYERYIMGENEGARVKEVWHNA